MKLSRNDSGQELILALGMPTGLLALVLLAGCMPYRPVSDPATTGVAACRPGMQECPLRITLPAKGGIVELEGRLTADSPAQSFEFQVDAVPTHLHWSLMQGIAVRFVLAGPDGDAQGPGLPADVLLEVPGRYVMSVSANTMAEGAYGPFKLNLWLSLD